VASVAGMQAAESSYVVMQDAKCKTRLGDKDQGLIGLKDNPTDPV